MATLLHLDSSGQHKNSVSRKLTAHYVDLWRKSNPEGRVIYRDLVKSDIGFLTNEHIVAFNSPRESLNASQQKLIEFPDVLMKELQDADVILFGAPMYNFSVPAVLKAWIDMIVRAGLTYSFAGGTPQGLLKNKRAVVVTTSGGDYSQAPMQQFDFVEPWFRSILGFIGINDVTVFRSFGTNPEVIATSSKLAEQAIEREFAVLAS
jgi:FMN-dependent NADH-azoreductase